MKLVKLITRNFRSFYGSHEVVFSDSDEKRVTVFHGENGSGKTTLLNAVYWCITGRFTPRFSDSQYVINKDAFRDGVRDCHVELYFTDDDKVSGHKVLYRAIRTGQNQNRSSPLKIFKILEGNSVDEELGEAFLRKLIPDSLVDWFFFDAEAIGSLELSGSTNFKSDLNRTLGFDLIQTLLRDLEILKSRKQKEISSAVKNKDLESVQQEIENCSRVLPGIEDLIQTTQANLNETQSSLARISTRLRDLPKSEPLERERSRLQSEVKSLKAEIEKLQQHVRQLVGESASSILLSEMAGNLKASLRVKEERARLPSPYSDVLVNEIIEEEVCLCGREVKKDSREAEALKGLLKFATTGELTRRVNQLQYFATDITNYAERFAKQEAELSAAIASKQNQLALKEERIQEIREELAKIDSKEVAKLEQQNAEFDRIRLQLSRELGAHHSQKDVISTKLSQANARFDNLKRRMGVSVVLERELDKVKKIISFLTYKLEEQQTQTIRILSVELNLVLRHFLVKNFKARIDPNSYAVKMYDDLDREVPPSTGEGQVLKFAFIAAVVALAAKKTQNKIDWLSEPTIAPLMLDAPFSALDPTYQGSVASNLAKQSVQLILMLSSGAWGKSVSDALDQYVGKRYLIISKEKIERGDRPVKTVTIKGREYQLNHYGCDREESVFVEVLE